MYHVLGFFDQLFETILSDSEWWWGQWTEKTSVLLTGGCSKRNPSILTRLNKVYGSAINNLHIHIPNKNLIRLRAQDLDKLIMMTTQYLSNVITESLFPFLDDKKSLNGFWKSREIKKDDWVSLARHVLTEVYSDPFMVPLEETDVNCAFKLKVEELTLSSYLEGVISTEIADPPRSSLSNVQKTVKQHTRDSTASKHREHRQTQASFASVSTTPIYARSIWLRNTLC